MGQTLEERFWSKVQIGSPDECWLWTASQRNGYGNLGIGGETMYSHRVAYYLTYGIDPADQLVCHTCDNRLCCNPNHLWLGAYQDNTTDMINKNRQAKGQQLPQTKLTEEQVLAIREDVRTQRVIANDYEVSQAQVGRIKRRESWGWLP